jgi:hypothetical protein
MVLRAAGRTRLRQDSTAPEQQAFARGVHFSRFTRAGVAKWQTQSTQNAPPQGVRVRIPLPVPTDSQHQVMHDGPERFALARLVILDVYAISLVHPSVLVYDD